MPMNIAFIATFDIPSTSVAGLHLMEMSQAFVRNGHKVTLIIPYRKGRIDLEVKDTFAYYGVEKIFDIIYIPVSNNKIGRYFFAKKAVKRAKSLNPDLVYTLTLMECWFSLKEKLNVMLESHLPIDINVRMPLMRHFKKHLFLKVVYNNNFKKIVAITNAIKDYYEKTYPFLKDRIQVAPDGAAPYPDSIEPIVLPNKGKRMQVGYTGDLLEGKGMGTISGLAALCAHVDFHIVGGKTQSDIDYWKTECKTLSNVFFHGHVPHGEIGRYILAFDVLLLPNQEKQYAGGDDIGPYTSPLKAFEYMAARKPIVASDLPVLREIFEDNTNALMAPPKDIELWADCLKKLSDDKELSQKISDNAYKDFAEKYSWFIRAKKILN